MAKQKLTVTTDAGTFTRTTARTYTHIVVAKGVRAELLEARRLRDLASARKNAAEYQDAHDNGTLYDARPAGTVGGDWDRECHAAFRAEGKYAGWAQDARERAAKHEARGVITADEGDTFIILGWAGRADLAAKVAVTELARDYRDVRIYALDGTRVR
jgi:hypothetical protein